MTSYEVTGIPLGAAFNVLLDKRVGDRFETHLDPDTERLLIGCGALRKVESEPVESEPVDPPRRPRRPRLPRPSDLDDVPPA